MVSLMDHSPGQRQYADRSKYRDYYQGKYHLTHDEMDRFEAEADGSGRHLVAAQSPDHRRHVPRPPYRPRQPRRRHRGACGRIPPARERDRRVSHHAGRGAGLPRQHGMHVLMGAPNIVRGGSHSGNVAAHQLASFTVCWTSSHLTITPPACWMPLSASPTPRTMPSPCHRRSVWSVSIRRRRWALTIAASSPRETRRPGAGAPSRRTYPDRPCLAPGKRVF